jgi:minor extracellular serine protease Vpr
MFKGLIKQAIPLIFCVLPSFAQFVPNRYTLLLDDPPVAARFQARAEMQSAAAINYRNQIEARQKLVMDELAARRIQVTGSVSELLNAVFVTAPAGRLSEMLAIPGVAAVRPMRRYKATLNRATQLMNAPAAWSTVGGQTNAGRGMKIAILDSGIDQTHPAFQDSSLSMPAGFPLCTTGHQEDCAFTNSKVIVARSYVRQLALANVTDSKNPAAQSQPDDYSPRDRLGHGTAVASAAAANQNSGTVNFTGMAPKAYLGNYKIVGSPGVNDSPTDDVMILAIQDALKDGMDVASLSWGGPALTGALDTGAACGIAAGQPCDPLAAAFEAAAQKGLVITVAAGNSGSDPSLIYQEPYPYFNSISSPASAPSVIGVGATTTSHALTPSVSVNAPDAPSNLKQISAVSGSSSFSPSVQGANLAPLVDITQLGNDGLACTTLPAGSLNGSYALILRGTCTFDTKTTNAQVAGAIGVILYMADASVPISTSTPNFVGPAVMIANSDGLTLKSYIDSHPGQIVTIDAAGIEMELAAYNSLEQISPPIVANQLASYSSFGPAPDGSIKPDLVATGGLDPNIAFAPGLYLAGQNYDPNGFLYTANRYLAADGTSFAAPIVAGAAAVVKQAHPTYTAAQIKSALVNSAAQDTTTDDQGTPVDVEWLGAGRLDAGAAAAATVAAVPVSVSFGYLKAASLPITKSLSITNRGSNSVTLTVAVAPNTNVAGITVAVDKPSLTLAAGATSPLNVTLSGSLPAAGSYSGAITLKASGVSVRVPYLFLVPSGVPYTVFPLFASIQGTPGQDGGTIGIQVIDQFGVPVAGTPISFSAARGTVTFQTVPASPTSFPTTSTCSPANSSSVNCATDAYGVAYAEVFLGTNTGSPTITAKGAGNTFTFNAFILPQPSITQGQILDNASFLPTVAPGSIIAIKGSNLMDADLLQNTSLGYDLSTIAPWPLGLDGVNVSFDVPSAGISVAAPIVAVSSGQINVQVPWELKGQKSAQVKVVLDESFGPSIYSNVVTAALADYTPAFFTNSTNVADALDTSFKVITSSNAAVRGQFISLFANGLGPVNNTPGDGAPAGTNSTTTTPCSVTIGAQTAPVQFCGLAPGFAIYQVNVQVPSGISTGNQPITISIGGQISPSGVAIPVQ